MPNLTRTTLRQTQGRLWFVAFGIQCTISNFSAQILACTVCHWRLTIRSSRPRIVASATCLRYASTRPPPRCGAA
jgi:hypothetical protein